MTEEFRAGVAARKAYKAAADATRAHENACPQCSHPNPELDDECAVWEALAVTREAALDEYLAYA